jgi:hypothetical protein
MLVLQALNGRCMKIKKYSACDIIELDAVLVRKETNAQFNA